VPLNKVFSLCVVHIFLKKLEGHRSKVKSGSYQEVLENGLGFENPSGA
jgi:hypothetical protein